jgi:hypothetical protein
MVERGFDGRTKRSWVAELLDPLEKLREDRQFSPAVAVGGDAIGGECGTVWERWY